MSPATKTKSATFEHRCPATKTERDSQSKLPVTTEVCKVRQEWELGGNDACGSCGFVPPVAWRRQMVDKLNRTGITDIDIDAVIGPDAGHEPTGTIEDPNASREAAAVPEIGGEGVGSA